MRTIITFLIGGLASWWAFTGPNPIDAKLACTEASRTAAGIMRGHQTRDIETYSLEDIERNDQTPGLEALKFSIGEKVLAVVDKKDIDYLGLNIDKWDAFEFGIIVEVGCQGALEWRRTENRARAWRRKLKQWWNRDTTS